VECGSNVPPDTFLRREDYYARRTGRQQRANELRAIAPRAPFHPIGIRGGFTTWRKKGKSEGERGKKKNADRKTFGLAEERTRAASSSGSAGIASADRELAILIHSFAFAARSGERGKERSRCASIVLRGVQE